jgi:hypothetical protein
MFMTSHLIDMGNTFGKVAHPYLFVLNNEVSVEFSFSYYLLYPFERMICKKLMEGMQDFTSKKDR